MENIKIATAQFEHASGDKNYNLKVIESLCATAVQQGASAIAFHECSITGYSFARHLSKEQLLDIAEYIPGGESITRLTEIAARYNIAVLAGLFEKVHTEIMMAQSFQDLSGQVINKVVRMLEHAEQPLEMLLIASQAAPAAVGVPGPSLVGVQTPDKALQQDDVDDLLASLGF